MILFINHIENYNHEFLTLQTHFNVVSTEMRIIFTVCIENSMTAVHGMCQKYTAIFSQLNSESYILLNLKVQNLNYFFGSLTLSDVIFS